MLPSLARLQQVNTVSCRDGMVGLQIEALIPVRVERSLAHARGFGLLAIDGSDSEWIGKACPLSECSSEDEMRSRPTENITLV
jgi:hypothetical protein